jgi:transcriptional regulator with XRE-family HTH domain
MPRKTLPANVVGPQIRNARKKIGLTQEAFAAKCQLTGLDISRSTLGQIEARLRFVSDEELIVLASLLGVSTDQLYPGDLTRRLRGKRIKSLRKKLKN